MIMKTVLVVLVAVVVVVIGDIALSKAMRPLGEIRLDWSVMRPWLAEAVRSRMFWLGIACNVVFFLLWASTLSWADLSVAMPLTAMSYVLGTIAARLVLAEAVSPLRWFGTLLIFAGVVCVSWSAHKP